MKKIIVCLLLFILPSISYSADENKSKRESVENLLAIIKAESMIDTIYSQMDQMMQSASQQFGIKPSEQEIFNKFMFKTISLMKSEITWEKMKEPMITIYLNHYSEKEIQDMVAFYESDSGQSMIRKMPAVMQDSMKLSQEILKDFLPKLEKLSSELEEELAVSRKQ
jgi:uncharacterized protein